MDDWRTIRLEDLCTRVTSGGTPKRTRLDYYASEPRGHPWVKSSELRDGYIRETDERITDLGLQESAAKLLPPDTVLVAMYGATAGRVGLLTIEAAVNQAVCALVLDRDRADSVFVFHALRSQYSELAGKSAGAAQQNLNADIVKSFALLAPSVVTQRRIASFLSAFDNLIEINERRIELLEGLARSLYHEWFVHFRFPGHEDVAIVDSELGPIPEGWEVRRLGDVAELRYGKSLPAKIRRPGEVPVVSSAGIIGTHDHALVEGPGIVIGRKGNVGSVWWVEDEFFPIDTTYYVESGLSLGFLYWQLQGLAFVDSHAAVPGLSRKQALALPILLPRQQVVERFDQVNRAPALASAALGATIDQLVATRDLLLPRLVTGRLDISDIDLGGLTPLDLD